MLNSVCDMTLGGRRTIPTVMNVIKPYGHFFAYL